MRDARGFHYSSYGLNDLGPPNSKKGFWSVAGPNCDSIKGQWQAFEELRIDKGGSTLITLKDRQFLTTSRDLTSTFLHIEIVPSRPSFRFRLGVRLR